MARKGPVTKDTSSIALGLAQIRIGASAANIGQIEPVLASADSIGSLANTTYRGNTDWYKLEGGFPLIEEFTTPIREAAMMECAFREISPYTLALLHGLDATAGGYTNVHSGEIKLGARISPAYIRMEACYTSRMERTLCTSSFPAHRFLRELNFLSVRQMRQLSR